MAEILTKIDGTSFNYLSQMAKNVIKEDFKKYLIKELEYCSRVSSDEHFTHDEKIKCINNIKKDANDRYDLLIAFGEETQADTDISMKSFLKYIDNFLEDTAK